MNVRDILHRFFERNPNARLEAELVHDLAEASAFDQLWTAIRQDTTQAVLDSYREALCDGRREPQ